MVQGGDVKTGVFFSRPSTPSKITHDSSNYSFWQGLYNELSYVIFDGVESGFRLYFQDCKIYTNIQMVSGRLSVCVKCDFLTYVRGLVGKEIARASICAYPRKKHTFRKWISKYCKVRQNIYIYIWYVAPLSVFQFKNKKKKHQS